MLEDCRTVYVQCAVGAGVGGGEGGTSFTLLADVSPKDIDAVAAVGGAHAVAYAAVVAGRGGALVVTCARNANKLTNRAQAWF